MYLSSLSLSLFLCVVHDVLGHIILLEIIAPGFCGESDNRGRWESSVRGSSMMVWEEKEGKEVKDEMVVVVVVGSY
jgi:hypothetical protein